MSAAPLLRPSALARFWALHPKTVVDWIRAGRLVGVRSPGAHYRLRASDVREFCARESMPVPPFARTDVTRIVLAGIAASGRRGIDRALAQKSVAVEAFASAVEGLVAAAREPPAIVAIDASSRELDADAAIRALRLVPELKDAIVIAFDASSKTRVPALVRAGATHALARGATTSTSLAKLLASLVT